MSEPTNDDHFFDAALSPPAGSANEGLREELARRTRRQVRWRRHARRLRGAGLLAGCFLAGASAMALWGWASSTPRIVMVTVATAARPVQPDPPPRRLTPAELELEAEQTFVRAESARRFREAGDRYLRELADHRAALRCYRNFLDEADEADLVVSPTDTWLLTSLKNARRQENLDANADN